MSEQQAYYDADTTSEQCEAITTEGARCRRNGTRWKLDSTGRLRWVCKEHDDPHQRFLTDPMTTTASEQQIDQ
jgi:hypothetical protein